jgi:signal transduction histidine kinase
MEQHFILERMQRMQVSQEQERSRTRRRNRYQQIEDTLQNYIYQHAERRAGIKRKLLFEYLPVVPILAVTIVLTFGLQTVVNNFALEDGVLVLAFSITALWWGWGPGLLLLFLGMVVLDFFFILPYGRWTLVTWPDMLQLLPFSLVGIVIGILSFQRDKGWVKTRSYARELATVRQKLEDEAQLKDRFLFMTSHELKTPVTSILIQSQLLQRRLKRQPMETAAVVQALEKIDERTRFLTTMIDELLDLSRMQSHRIKLDRQLYDMNVLCQEVTEDQRIVSGRSILLQKSATPATVYGDYRRLAQVVSNLVNNAIKYSPEPTPIEVSVYQHPQHIILQVRDYGPGIEQDHLTHIFEPFYRTPSAQSSATSGLGLGLAITRQIIDLHEGRIWCTSEQGSGSTFFVALPTQDRHLVSS